MTAREQIDRKVNDPALTAAVNDWLAGVRRAREARERDEQARLAANAAARPHLAEIAARVPDLQKNAHPGQTRAILHYPPPNEATGNGGQQTPTRDSDLEALSWLLTQQGY